jgi:ketosteroid isomerase-like protein
MSATRRSFLAAASSGLALQAAVKSAGAAPSIVSDAEIAELLSLSRDSNAALMRGDVATYRALITPSDDFTLMSPFGGKPTHGATLTDEQWEAMGRFFKNGDFELELVQAYGSADMVVLALIERSHVEVGGLPAQEWSLRVTLVYRREGSEWRLAHRHADPLVTGISLQQAAALTRGEEPCAGQPRA